MDTAAVLSVANQEGLSGRPGDYVNGVPTSFGPFQLHQGGAYPGSAPQSPTAAQAWASSPAGIDYALAGIASVSKGRTGSDAISAIVNGFERSSLAKIPGTNTTYRQRELTNANASYGRFQTFLAGYTPGKGAPTPGFFTLATGAVTNAPSTVSSEVKGVTKGVTSVGDFLGKITSTNFLYRAGEVTLGAVLTLTGLYLLAKTIGLGGFDLPSVPGRGGPDPVDAAFDEGVKQGELAQARLAGRKSVGAVVTGQETRESVTRNERAARIRRESDAFGDEVPF